MKQSSDFPLSESHRRVIAALLRGFEDMLSEIERWIDPAPGVLIAVEDRLGPAEEQRLRALLARMSGELRRMGNEIGIDASPRSAARSIEALLVEHLSLLEETAGGELRGYGELDSSVRERLEKELARLHTLFGEMLDVVRRSSREH
ncbi:MAG: hypothetical protein KGL59_02100 [Acidobacteriota bacterium]|nr:hypothetical protein [Acidobacteriota bacterium]